MARASSATIRSVVFWSHLVIAVGAGLVLAVMAATGSAVAFEPQILAWAERHGPAAAEPPAGGSRLPLEELLARVRAARPGAPTAVTIDRARPAAVRVSVGRDDGALVDPFTGGLRALPGQSWRGFLRTMIDWHRWLGRGEVGRAVGRALTGSCNLAFLLLALSGLYLWWPRTWRWRVVRPALWFRRGLAGKARDWNWHNTIGFWCLPVFIIITASGLVMSYRWAANLLFVLAGEAPPAQASVSPPSVTPPVEGAAPPSLDALLASVEREVPAWTTLTLRLRTGRDEGEERARPGPGEGSGRGGRGRGGARPHALMAQVANPVSKLIRHGARFRGNNREAFACDQVARPPAPRYHRKGHES
jgi:uncharacterized iron-regulated membrane protein